MRALLVTIMFIGNLSGYAQIKPAEKCDLLQTILNDSLILKNVFFDDPSSDKIFIIDTNQVYFNNCIPLPIFGKNVIVIHEKERLTIYNKRLILEIEKVITNKKGITEVNVYYKNRNFFAKIKYKKSRNKFIHISDKSGYY